MCYHCDTLKINLRPYTYYTGYPLDNHILQPITFLEYFSRNHVSRYHYKQILKNIHKFHSELDNKTQISNR